MIEITNMYDTDIFVGFPYNKALVEIIKRTSC